MILSVSRRTDIPAFFSEWFYNRIRAGFVCVRNPMNSHQVSRIKLSPDLTECIVFWTKNPSPDFIGNLHLLDDLGYRYYVLFTLTSYDRSIERNVPEKRRIIQAFKMLSEKIGKGRVIWRYDPVLLTDRVTVSWHATYFDWIAEQLRPYTEKCIISFVDVYPRIRKRMLAAGIRVPDERQIQTLASAFHETAKKNGLKLDSCCEAVDLTAYDIIPGHCIDGALINGITGKKYCFERDRTQRRRCGCVSSVDIGAYNTCRHDCVYCYANENETVNGETAVYNPASPLLCSSLSDSDRITDRQIRLYKRSEPELFS